MKYRSILFLCTGNACRSPMAAGLLKKIAKNRDMVVRSAGTHTIDGFPPSESSIAVMKENGIDISHHKTRSITKKMLHGSDLVFAMAPEHVDYIRTFYPAYRDKVFLLKKFGRDEEFIQDEAVHDPIGGDKSIYRECCSILKDEIVRVASILFNDTIRDEESEE